jgi:hypothetical protein
VNTQLRASRLRLYAGQNVAGEPVYVEVGNGFVVVRPDLHSPDGVTDTGLAIAPNLTVDASGTQLLEDTSRWHLIHVRSGKTIPGASYAALDQAGLLAGILAQVDWNQAEQEMSTAEIRLIGGTVSEYNRVLAGELRARPADSTTGETATTPPATEPLVKGTAVVPERPGATLVGRLVADRSGGVARVLDVDEKTGLLLLVDSLGQRYELYPEEVRQPADQDFELVRVAQSFDPATRTETTCAGCGQDSHQPGAGQRWYRMARQSFCQVCAARYAAEESYLLDDEITAELEPTSL